MTIEQEKKSLQTTVGKVKTLDDLQSLEVKYLGRKGVVNELLDALKDLPGKKRRLAGRQLNIFKSSVISLLGQKKIEVIKKQEKQTFLDITLPGKSRPQGSLHLVTYAIDEIVGIFEKLGFIRMSYREIEWEYYSFESLNMPKGHPARDDFETFFLDEKPHPQMGKMLLTPHTSSGQNREMKRLGRPPIKMINLAKTYRRNWDTTHVPMFHQFEGFCVDEGINLTHLIGTIDFFAKNFFGQGRDIRLRPFHFQFTEPSFEVDITCDICDGKGKLGKLACKVCKSGWLELGGAGMVHPYVLKQGGIDPNKYTGWAFGFGVERVMMMKQGLKLDDLRVLYSGDIRFLKQF